MPVVTQYVVVRNGEEKMTFATKAEADAHDKMLDMVERLLPLIERSEVVSDEQKLEDLAFFLAREREDVLIALGAKKPPKKKTTEKTVKTKENADKAEPQSDAA